TVVEITTESGAGIDVVVSTRYIGVVTQLTLVPRHARQIGAHRTAVIIVEGCRRTQRWMLTAIAQGNAGSQHVGIGLVVIFDITGRRQAQAAPMETLAVIQLIGGLVRSAIPVVMRQPRKIEIAEFSQ